MTTNYRTRQNVGNKNSAKMLFNLYTNFSGKCFAHFINNYILLLIANGIIHVYTHVYVYVYIVYTYLAVNRCN